MCGIVGIVSANDPKETRKLVDHMVKLVAHRGPDDEGIWQKGNVCFGHRRLSILDLTPAGHQPFQYMGGKYVIVFNGEIYNYIELKKELSGQGYIFLSETDTEVVLAAYDYFGVECVNHFNGMWAFALWDSKEQILFASRDRFGKKPFYYVDTSSRFVFASEIKAVIAGSGINPSPNIDRIYDFALARWLDHTNETMFRGVYQLPPGHNLVMKQGCLEVYAYWSLEPKRVRGMDDEVIEEFKELFIDSVKIRLRSDVPVGCMLSGGIDSSSVTCVAASLYDRPHGFPLTTFTTSADISSTEASVLPFVYKRHDLRKVESRPDAKQFRNDIEKVIWHQEEPFADGSMISHFDIMRQAQKVGVPVVLGGQGGDEILVGYGSQIWALAGEFLQGMHLQALSNLLFEYGHSQDISVVRGFAHAVWHAIPGGWRDRLAALQGQNRIEWLQKDLYQNRSRHPATKHLGIDYFDNYLLNIIKKWTLPGFLHYEDRNSMAFGIETRAPFLDYRLAEFLFSLRPEAKISHGQTKYLLRVALRDLVPSEILTRPWKEPFLSPLANWLRNNEDYVRSVLSDSQTRAISFISPPGLQKIVDKFFKSEPEPVDGIWRALCVCLWNNLLISKSQDYCRFDDIV